MGGSTGVVDGSTGCAGEDVCAGSAEDAGGVVAPGQVRFAPPLPKAALRLARA